MKFGTTGPPQGSTIFHAFDCPHLPSGSGTPRRRDEVLKRCEQVADELHQERFLTTATAAHVQQKMVQLRCLATREPESNPLSGADSKRHESLAMGRDLLGLVHDALRARDSPREEREQVEERCGAWMGLWNRLRGRRRPAPPRGKRELHPAPPSPAADRPSRTRAVSDEPPSLAARWQAARASRRARGECSESCGTAAGPHVPQGLQRPGKETAPSRKRGELRCRTERGLSGEEWKHPAPQAPFAMDTEGTLFLPGGVSGQTGATFRYGKGIAGVSRGGVPQLPSVTSHCHHPANGDPLRPRYYLSVFDAEAPKAHALRSGDGCIERRRRSKRPSDPSRRPLCCFKDWLVRQRAEQWNAVPSPPRSPPPQSPGLFLPMSCRPPTPPRLRGASAGKHHTASGSANIFPAYDRDRPRPRPPQPISSYIDHHGKLCFEL